MIVNNLKADQVYLYTDGQRNLTVIYYGMKEDRYLFIPYDLKKKHYNGVPNTLCEKEVITLKIYGTLYESKNNTTRYTTYPVFPNYTEITLTENSMLVFNRKTSAHTIRIYSNGVLETTKDEIILLVNSYGQIRQGIIFNNYLSERISNENRQINAQANNIIFLRKAQPYQDVKSQFETLDFENGTISQEGVEAASTSRIRTGFFDTIKFNSVNFISNAEIAFFVFLFDAKKKFLERKVANVTISDFFKNQSIFLDNENCRYYRLVLGYTNPHDITPNNLFDMVQNIGLSITEKPVPLIQETFLNKELSVDNFELGSVSSDQGLLLDATNRIRSQKFSISKGGNLTVTTQAGVKAIILTFDRQNNFISSSDWQKKGIELIYEDEKLLYITVFAYDDDRDIVNITDIVNNISVKYLSIEHFKQLEPIFNNQLIITSHMAGKMWGDYAAPMLIPEESIISLGLAVRAGYKAAEIDVRITKDNQFVCMHDTTINRTMINADGTTISGTVTIKNKTLKELQDNYKYNTSNTLYQTKIFTLDEFLAMCSKNGIKPLFHMGDVSKNNLSLFLKVVHKYVYHDYIFMSNDIELLYAIRLNNKQAILLYQNNSSILKINSVLSKLNYVNKPCGFSTMTLDFLTPSNCQTLKNKGYYVQASIPYSESRALEMFNNGVNMLLTNGNLDTQKGLLIKEYNTDSGFTEIEHTGTITDNGLMMNSGQTISFSIDPVFLGAIDLTMVMSGSVNINIPFFYDGNVMLKENESLRFNYISHDNAIVIITAQSDCLIRSIDFKFYRL